MTRSERRAARIAVDLLGGDGAPAVVVGGAQDALTADPDLQVLLVGPDRGTTEWLAGLPAGLRDRIDRMNTETAAQCARAAVDCVSGGRADAIVSAGSTGTSVAAAVAGFGRLPGVPRPALAVIIPAGAGPVVLLDVGASPEVEAVELCQHAHLGAAYANVMLGLAEPRVGLMSIGAEDGKGDRLRLAAAGWLASHELAAGGRYVGNVEGHDVPLGTRADVVITDGFTGNVLLKGMEGSVALAGGGVPTSVAPRAAMLLGVLGTVVVCHGAASVADLASGVALAASAVRADLTSRVGTGYQDVQEQGNQAAAGARLAHQQEVYR